MSVARTAGTVVAVGAVGLLAEFLAMGVVLAAFGLVVAAIAGVVVLAAGVRIWTKALEQAADEQDWHRVFDMILAPIAGVISGLLLSFTIASWLAHSGMSAFSSWGNSLTGLWAIIVGLTWVLFCALAVLGFFFVPLWVADRSPFIRGFGYITCIFYGGALAVLYSYT